MREMSRTAVIADLSPDSAARTGRLLAGAGVRALSMASDGRRALLDALALRPDVVVADAVLPALGGLGADIKALHELDAATIAALVPSGLAQAVADELHKRLAG